MLEEQNTGLSQKKLFIQWSFLEEENKSKGRRKLVLSETDEETPKDKGIEIK